jgi:glutamate carboxypeptidase
MDGHDLVASMVETTHRLVNVESPTEDLDACARVVEAADELSRRWLLDPGRIEEHEGRPIWRWGAPSPRILLLGHIDTVWPMGTLDRIPFAVNGDRMTGPGVFDMKAGVVQGWAALALTAARADGPVGMLLTTDEETGSLASRALIAEAIENCEAVFVLEPSADGALKTQRKGTSWYHLTFSGRAAHAGLDPERGINASVEAAHFITEAVTWADPEAGTSVTPTVLSSGTTANTVPAEATLTVDVRAWTRAEQERVDDLVRSWPLKHPEATWSIGGGIDRSALEPDISADLFARTQQVAQTLGLPALTECAVGGASDGNITAAAGIPTLDGLGAVGDGAHADHEWASVSGMEERARLLAGLLQTLADAS